MKFFGRDEIIKEILSILEGEPDLVYFIYGPMNSGKTAVINEIINNRLDRDKYVVFYINLRGIFISKYEDFEAKLRATKTEGFRLIIDVLFEEYEGDRKPIEIVKSLIKDVPSLCGIPTPKNTFEEILKKKTTKNVFKHITDVLMEIKKEGKQPVIIIDELQKIGDMRINGFLIYELFNYFVDLTKELHLCHVFCLSSDSLFIEQVYNKGSVQCEVVSKCPHWTWVSSTSSPSGFIESMSSVSSPVEDIKT
jgi:AAA+ ATPase superfamily predicted ATPase